MAWDSFNGLGCSLFPLAYAIFFLWLSTLQLQHMNEDERNGNKSMRYNWVLFQCDEGRASVYRQWSTVESLSTTNGSRILESL